MAGLGLRFCGAQKKFGLESFRTSRVRVGRPWPVYFQNMIDSMQQFFVSVDISVWLYQVLILFHCQTKRVYLLLDSVMSVLSVVAVLLLCLKRNGKDAATMLRVLGRYSNSCVL